MLGSHPTHERVGASLSIGSSRAPIVVDNCDARIATLDQHEARHNEEKGSALWNWTALWPKVGLGPTAQSGTKFNIIIYICIFYLVYCLKKRKIKKKNKRKENAKEYKFLLNKKGQRIWNLYPDSVHENEYIHSWKMMACIEPKAMAIGKYGGHLRNHEHAFCQKKLK